MKTLDQCKDEVAKKYDYINWAHFSTDYYAYQEKVLSWLDEAAELYAQEVAKEKDNEIQALIDRKESFRESIKAAIENVISLQEAEQNETFNSGKEEAFNYAIEMLDKHFNDHYIVLADSNTIPNQEKP